MIFDMAEIEGYRGIHASVLVQIRKDLNSPVQQFFASDYGSHSPMSFDWYQFFASHLAALGRDKEGIHSALRVPALHHAVRMWIHGNLLGWHVTGETPRDQIQREVNNAIQFRLDGVFDAGDPLLAAICVMESPKGIHFFAAHSGLRAEKADEIANGIIEMARPIAERAWDLFESVEATPTSVSMFRPPRTVGGDKPNRQYFR
jgi:hypothetical protein